MGVVKGDAAGCLVSPVGRAPTVCRASSLCRAMRDDLYATGQQVMAGTVAIASARAANESAFSTASPVEIGCVVTVDVPASTSVRWTISTGVIAARDWAVARLTVDGARRFAEMGPVA